MSRRCSIVLKMMLLWLRSLRLKVSYMYAPPTQPPTHLPFPHHLLLKYPAYPQLTHPRPPPPSPTHTHSLNLHLHRDCPSNIEHLLGVREAGVHYLITLHQRCKTGRFAHLSLALGINELGNRLAARSQHNRMIHFCSPVT